MAAATANATARIVLVEIRLDLTLFSLPCDFLIGWRLAQKFGPSQTERAPWPLV
jgi:hypothetical protein